MPQHPKKKKKRFIVRDFEFNENEVEQEKQERNQLGSDLKKQLVTITLFFFFFFFFFFCLMTTQQQKGKFDCLVQDKLF